MQNNRYLKANQRDQDSYCLLYGHKSAFLEKHKELTLATSALQGSEQALYEYSLGVRDVLGLFEKPFIERVERKPSRFQATLDEPYTSFLELEKRKTDPLPDYEFIYEQPPELLPFKSQKHITVQVQSNRVELVASALKLFPDSYLITFDGKLVCSLREQHVEMGVLARREAYTCCLEGCKLDRATCNTLFGIEKLNYLTNNRCYTKCRYLRDIQMCKNAKTSTMRPFTFLTQVFKTSYAPRALMVIDGLSFEDSLKSFFAFSAPMFKSANYFAELKSCINSKIYKLKTYEKKGWSTLIGQLRRTAPSDERYPSFKGNRFEQENDSTLLSYLKRNGSHCTDGLDSKDFARYCDLKMNIFKMNLALSAKNPYTVRRGIEVTHIPSSTEHIWKFVISKYAKYILTVSTRGK